MLPGKLTVRHIQLAEARGESFIIYKKIRYPLEVLRGLAGIRTVERKPAISKKLDERKPKDGDGSILEFDRSISESESQEGEES
jgi:hypothetical protein